MNVESPAVALALSAAPLVYQEEVGWPGLPNEHPLNGQLKQSDPNKTKNRVY